MFEDDRTTMLDHAPKHCPIAYRTFRAWRDVNAEYWDGLFDAEDAIIEKAAKSLACARIQDASVKHEQTSNRG